MEWPNTEKSPHDLVHVFMTDPAITGVSEYKDAADAMHESMHGIEGATSTMEGNLDTLEDVIGKLGAPVAAPAATAPASTPKEPGFEAVFAITGILAIAYLVLRRTR
jgi:PGF-CTERM protein